jgi:hypothetical protein
LRSAKKANLTFGDGDIIFDYAVSACQQADNNKEAGKSRL